MKKYVCTVGFAVERFDDDGFFTGKWNSVDEGEVWTEEETDFRLVGGKDTVRMFRQKGKREWWLEITKETLTTHFALVENN